MNGNFEITLQPHHAWPLLGTRMAHVRLTWAEWTVQQASQVARTRPLASATILDQQGTSTRLERGAASRLTWPLPATQLPSARLTWAEWRAARCNTPAANQAEQRVFDRA